MRRKMLVAAAALLGMSGVSHAENNLLFILDASNSMWGQVEGTAKIDTAKSAFGALVGQLPAGTNVGLMAYGHRDRSSCSDIEVLAPIGASPDRVRQTVQALSPRGKTPIAASLEQSWEAFIGSEEQTNSVVLVSDGIETCEGDPCAVAAELVQRGINVRVHVVGFDVDAEAREQLECIAEKGGGQYFSADTTEGFSEAVTRTIEIAREDLEPAPAPEPEVAGPRELFRDDFDGEELADHWEVLNPDPSAFIVEDGSLLIVTGSVGSLASDDVQNLFRLAHELPSGDWTVTAKFNVEYQTGVERIFIALFQDADNYLEAAIKPWTRVYGYHWFNLSAEAIKRTNGENEQFDGTILGGKSNEPMESVLANLAQPLLLRIAKQGRSYTAGWMQEGAEEPKWEELPKLTILRQRGDIVLGFSQWKETNGESLATIDWIKIEAPE